MGDETCLSEALVTFLVEVAQEKNVPKIKSRKKQCCAEFLSFFVAFNLQEFSANLEKVTEEHIQASKDPSISNFVRMRELAFVSELKLGCMRILDWLFTFEIEECQIFIADGEKAVDKVMASVRYLGIDDSSSFGSGRSSEEPTPTRIRKRRKISRSRVTSPELYRGEIEKQESRCEELSMSSIADVPDVQLDDPEPSVLPDMELEEGALPVGNDGIDPDFRLEPLCETESNVIRRRPRRRRTVDNRTQLSDYVMEKQMLECSKLSITVEENRDNIWSLVSKEISARSLLNSPSVDRCPALTKMFAKSFKRLWIGGKRRVNRMSMEQDFQTADDEDETLHGFIEPGDDRAIQNGGRMTPLDGGFLDYRAFEDSQSRSAESDDGMAFSDGKVFDADCGLDVSSLLNFEDKLAEVHSMVLRAATHFHQQDNIRLRYACLSDVARSISESEAPIVFKCLLMLSESGRLYIKQPSAENDHIIIFPRGQAKEQNPPA